MFGRKKPSRDELLEECYVVALVDIHERRQAGTYPADLADDHMGKILNGLAESRRRRGASS